MKLEINLETDAMMASAAAMAPTAPLEAAKLYAAVLQADPFNITAHNALERLNAPQAYSRWMGVNCLIDPRDDIFRFFANHEIAASPIREYLSDGWRTLTELMIILESLDKPLFKTESVLEFAAGFGRFTRHLAKVLPGRVTCTDVLPGSMEFLREQFGVKTIESSHDPEELVLAAQYDLIFVLSLFTHLPPSKWQPWLRKLGSAVRPGGMLIFSVSNEAAGRELGVVFNEDGTRFLSSSESPSLDADVYGTTYTTTQFVEKQVEIALGDPLTHFFPRAFWAGQDAVVIRF
jgi:SAM-dependent methyltransferase